MHTLTGNPATAAISLGTENWSQHFFFLFANYEGAKFPADNTEHDKDNILALTTILIIYKWGGGGKKELCGWWGRGEGILVRFGPFFTIMKVLEEGNSLIWIKKRNAFSLFILVLVEKFSKILTLFFWYVRESYTNKWLVIRLLWLLFFIEKLLGIKIPNT